MIRFFLILSVLTGYTYFKAWQLVPEFPDGALLATLLLMVVMFSSMFVQRSQAKVFESLWFKLLAWAGALAMGFWGTFIILSIPVDALQLVVSLVTRFIGGNFEPVFEAVHWAVAAASLVMGIFGLFEVSRGPRVKEIKVRREGLPSALGGLKIAQISDLHVGPTIRKDYVEKVVQRTNQTEPDLIFITGDLADAEVSSILHHLEPLRGLKARYGVFYVTGNHEYYWGAEGFIGKIKELGHEVLLNEHRLLTIDGVSVMIAGVTDPMGQHMIQGHAPDLRKAMSSDAQIHFKILLAHRPDFYDDAEKYEFDLQFSGHTHAGQFFPFSLLIPLAHKYYRGLYRHGDLSIYVNPGTGYWGPPNRLGIASEITLVELTQTGRA